MERALTAHAMSQGKTRTRRVSMARNRDPLPSLPPVGHQGADQRPLATPGLPLPGLWPWLRCQPVHRWGRHPQGPLQRGGCAIEMWRLWTRCYHVQPDPDTGKRRRCNIVTTSTCPCCPWSTTSGWLACRQPNTGRAPAMTPGPDLLGGKAAPGHQNQRPVGLADHQPFSAATRGRLAR